MRRPMPKMPPVRNKTIIFTGGVKEDISQLEMKAGELISGYNYEENDGVSHGYTSIDGYERYDGSPLASSIDGNPEDDVAREARRTAILEIPGSGSVEAAHIYDTDVYPVRNGLMYKSTVSGWSASIGSLTPGGSYTFINAAFSLLPTLQRVEVFFLVNGVDYPQYYNGTTLVPINHVNLPTTVFPTRIIEFKGRLFLGYEDGRVYFSAIEDPTDFDPVNGAGVFEMGQMINNLIVTPGDSLAVFCENKIIIITSIYDGTSGAAGNDTLSTYKFRTDEFSKRSGAIPFTAKRILGQIIYMDDRGLSSMETSDVFGDFSAKSISKNVQSSLLLKKNLVTVAGVDRAKNQYRLYFNNGTGYIVTFDMEKKVRGITNVVLPNPVKTFSEGADVDGDDFRVFTSNTGYLYKMDSGTSFDGAEISTKMTTAFFSYNSPSNWKKYHKITLETTSSALLEIKGKTEFNYRSNFVPKVQEDEFETGDIGGTWGIDYYSDFVYGSAEVQTPTLYVQGVGNNMSITIVTSNKYAKSHTIHSAIIDYSIIARMA